MEHFLKTLVLIMRKDLLPDFFTKNCFPTNFGNTKYQKRKSKNKTLIVQN